jgi:hypothetical protein
MFSKLIVAVIVVAPDGGLFQRSVSSHGRWIDTVQLRRRGRARIFPRERPAIMERNASGKARHRRLVRHTIVVPCGAERGRDGRGRHDGNVRQEGWYVGRIDIVARGH